MTLTGKESRGAATAEKGRNIWRVSAPVGLGYIQLVLRNKVATVFELSASLSYSHTDVRAAVTECDLPTKGAYTKSFDYRQEDTSGADCCMMTLHATKMRRSSTFDMFFRFLFTQERRECFHEQDIARPVPLQRHTTESKRVITPCYELGSISPSHCFRRETECPAAGHWDRLTEQNGAFSFLIESFCFRFHPWYSSLTAGN
jgi:hypothetical protein